MITQSVKAEEFEQILLSHTEMCYSVALALTRNPARAQDLARQVLTGAWQMRYSANGSHDIKKKLLTALRERSLENGRETLAVVNESVFVSSA